MVLLMPQGMKSLQTQLNKKKTLIWTIGFDLVYLLVIQVISLLPGRTWHFFS